MNINRHNYEEHFILYMDNELNSAERRMVEDFVEKNPDLKDELDVLLQSKLIPNQNIVFSKKNELFRSSESSAVTTENYEELLLLYIDNELTPQEKLQVEKFIENSPQAKQELEILQKTKLQTEEIRFPYKDSLYHRTEKPDSYRVRLISMKWLRVSAAAILLLAVGISTVVLINNNPSAPTEEGTEFTTKTDQNIPQKDPSVNPEKNIDRKKVEDEKVNNENIAGIVQPDKKKNTVSNQPTKNKLPVPEKNKEQLLIADNDRQSFTNTPSADYADNRSNELNNVTNVIKNEKTFSRPYNPNFAVTIGDDKPYINTIAGIDSDETDEGKSNLRSFLRKATRFFERRTNISATDEDDRLLIGGFAVKLK